MRQARIVGFFYRSRQVARAIGARKAFGVSEGRPNPQGGDSFSYVDSLLPVENFVDTVRKGAKLLATCQVGKIGIGRMDIKKCP